ncbi:hypothetical protein KCP69_04685 [Salmonella enterica subsp. enterica]|nr:hypothetical protein KCP69_04685 [Salmonella enterica subsp. enterica]
MAKNHRSCECRTGEREPSAGSQAFRTGKMRRAGLAAGVWRGKPGLHDHDGLKAIIAGFIKCQHFLPPHWCPASFRNRRATTMPRTAFPSSLATAPRRCQNCKMRDAFKKASFIPNSRAENPRSELVYRTAKSVSGRHEMRLRCCRKAGSNWKTSAPERLPFASKQWL